MNRHSRWIACLAAGVLATACTVYKYQDLEPEALAKAKKAAVLKVQTGEESIAFPESEPAAVTDGAVVGNLYLTYTVDPEEIVEISPEKKAAKVVLKDGTRFRVVGSEITEGGQIRCQALKRVGIPLGEVVRARVRTVNTGASVLSTLAGVVLVAGALALDATIYGDDESVDFSETFTGSLVDAMIEGIPAGGGDGPRRSNTALLGMKDAGGVAGEKEFWTTEWTPVEARPAEDGKLRVELGNATGVPRGVDRARLMVVDHPAGTAAAPDAFGIARAYGGLAAPDSATDKSGRDIRELLAARDGAFWRTGGGDPGPQDKGLVRDEILLTFARPKGARRARLVVDAANSTWRSEFAREVLARAAPAPPAGAAPPAAGAGQKKGKPARPEKFAAPSGFRNWEFSTLRVRIKTVLGWETGQVIFAVGPLAAEDLIYELDLGDVVDDTLQLALSPPAGYWLIDRLAVDFGRELAVATTEVAAEAVEGPDGAQVIEALAAEDATTLVLAPGDPPALLTFTLPPPPNEGTVRSLFLRTFSCYEMPGGAPGRGSGSKEVGHARPKSG